MTTETLRVIIDVTLFKINMESPDTLPDLDVTRHPSHVGCGVGGGGGGGGEVRVGRGRGGGSSIRQDARGRAGH